MKRLVIGLVVAVAVMAGIAPQTVHAAVPEIQIIGVVFDKGVPVPNLSVLVECWETGFAERPITDTNGVFYVATDKTHCPLGTILKARTNIPNTYRAGFQFKTVQPVNEMHIDLIDTHNIPEFGWVSGVLAAGTGGGLIIFTRRRYAHSMSGNGRAL